MTANKTCFSLLQFSKWHDNTYFQQIKIAVGEEVVFRANRNKRESPVEDEEADFNDHEIDEDNEDDAERYFLS